jgi:hypothetical protein
MKTYDNWTQQCPDRECDCEDPNCGKSTCIHCGQGGCECCLDFCAICHEPIHMASCMEIGPWTEFGSSYCSDCWEKAGSKRQ